MALVYPFDLDQSLGYQLPADRQSEVVSCIDAAQSWIARSAGIRSLEKETADVLTILDGCSAYGDELMLPADLRPVWHSDADLITVTENGVALTVSTTWSSNAAVIVRNHQEANRRVSLIRPYGWLRWGPQNVTVSCKVGFDQLGAAVLAVPEYVRRLIIEVALLYFTSPQAASKTSVSKAGSAVSIEHSLSAAGRDALTLLRGV